MDATIDLQRSNRASDQMNRSFGLATFGSAIELPGLRVGGGLVVGKSINMKRLPEVSMYIGAGVELSCEVLN